MDAVLIIVFVLVDLEKGSTCLTVSLQFMEIRENRDSSNSVQLAVSSVGRLERGVSVLKEKIILIILSTILLIVSSLSASFFIVDTIITTPPFNSVKTIYTVCCEDYHDL